MYVNSIGSVQVTAGFNSKVCCISSPKTTFKLGIAPSCVVWTMVKHVGEEFNSNELGIVKVIIPTVAGKLILALTMVPHFITPFGASGLENSQLNPDNGQFWPIIPSGNKRKIKNQRNIKN